MSKKAAAPEAPPPAPASDVLFFWQRFEPGTDRAIAQASGVPLEESGAGYRVAHRALNDRPLPGDRFTDMRRGGAALVVESVEVEPRPVGFDPADTVYVCACSPLVKS